MEGFLRNIVLSFLLIAFLVPGLLAQTSSLRVFDAEGDEIASLELLDNQGAKYILLDEINNLFSGIRKNVPLIGQINVDIRGKRIVLKLGQNQIKIDGEDYVLARPPVSISNKAAVPVEFLNDILPMVIGNQINLDQDNWKLQISREPYAKKDAQQETPQIPIDPSSSNFRIIIDPGHGGHDGGARSRDGQLEKDITLKMAQKMKELLAAQENIDVYLTRSGDNYIATAERTNLANKLRGDVYVSIHFNSSPSQQSSGFRIYVNSNRMRLGKVSDLEADMFSRSGSVEGKQSEMKQFLIQSRLLAKGVADGLEKMELEGKPPKEAFLAVMDNLAMPGVLVELLYLSNPQDLRILSRSDFIESVSQSLCNSLLAFRTVLENDSRFTSVRSK